ncbi:MAG: efflux RND transporter permease subunit [Deltaproteobacteria bacterium]
MIRKIVELALAFPVWVGALVAVIVGGGFWAYQNLDIEAYPDPVPPRIEVITQPPGWSAEEVERYVTVPLETGLSGMLGLDVCRSISIFQLSDIKCYFKWDTDYRWDRQTVLDRLQLITLPNNIQPGLSPDNPIGEIYRYTLSAPGYDLTDVKAAEDWVLEKAFKQVPGVLDVSSFGGLTKQYHVDIDPYRLKGHNLALQPVVAALQNANQNVGGNILPLGEQAFDVRGLGLIKTTKDIEQVVIAEQKGIPVRVGDIADVGIGHATRLGIVGHDDDPDVVEGIVLMRRGGDTLKTLEGVRAKVDEIHQYHLLPPGMDVKPYYDRTKLVHVTTHTVLHNLVEGMVLVVLILLLFLSNVRAALITALNIPLALFIAFILMVLSGTPANLISLGAVDFGIIIDSTVIMMENCFHHLSRVGPGSTSDRVLEAAGEVGMPMAFSTIIIGVAFLPLFTLTGVEGVIFSPMAHTYAFAIGGAIILALTLTPNLARRLPIGIKDEDNALMRVLHRIYNPLFDIALRSPKLALLAGAIPVVLSIVLFPLLGREFMPKLEEGNFWIRATLPLSISLEESAKYVGRMRQIMRKHQEIETVISQLGRPDDGTDVAGFYNLEFFVPLHPFDEWPRGETKEHLTKVLNDELAVEFPGVVFNFSQNIEDNVEEALSGVKGENTVKIAGPDLAVDESLGRQIVDVMSHVRGIEDLGMFQSLGQPNVEIVPDRALCARYGLNVGDVANVIQAAVGGQAITQVFEGEQRFDLTVRWLEQYRADIPRLKEILVGAPDGSQIPLGQIASFKQENGPALIYREGSRRYVPVKFSVRGRDLASAIEEAQAKIAQAVHLPYDVHLEWAGEINELRDAEARLKTIVPLTLILIALLVYAAVKRWKDMVIVLIEIPVACTGGLLALLLTNIHFSISAAMGFISIFGIAIQDGILVVSFAQQLWDQGHGLVEGARLSSERRFRPVLMTTLVATLGLAPAALSSAIGSQTQKPLAVVVIGGSLMVAVLTRILQPPLLVLAHQNEPRWRLPPTEVPKAPLVPIQHA